MDGCQADYYCNYTVLGIWGSATLNISFHQIANSLIYVLQC